MRASWAVVGFPWNSLDRVGAIFGPSKECSLGAPKPRKASRLKCFEHLKKIHCFGFKRPGAPYGAFFGRLGGLFGRLEATMGRLVLWGHLGNHLTVFGPSGPLMPNPSGHNRSQERHAADKPRCNEGRAHLRARHLGASHGATKATPTSGPDIWGQTTVQRRPETPFGSHRHGLAYRCGANLEVHARFARAYFLHWPRAWAIGLHDSCRGCNETRCTYGHGHD